MKSIIATTILALGIVAGIAGSANAEPFNPTTFFEEVDKSSA
jgi:hypothetical protein